MNMNIIDTPEPPSNFTINTINYIGNWTVILSWEPSLSSDAGYNVRISPSIMYTNNTVGNFSCNCTNVTFVGLNQSVIYYFSLTAVNCINKSIAINRSIAWLPISVDSLYTTIESSLTWEATSIEWIKIEQQQTPIVDQQQTQELSSVFVYSTVGLMSDTVYYNSSIMIDKSKYNIKHCTSSSIYNIEGNDSTVVYEETNSKLCLHVHIMYLPNY